MRSFIAIAVLCAAFSVYPACAEERAPEARPSASDLFSGDGVYIAPGDSEEVTIAEECRLLTNSDPKIGFYITPALHEAWPNETDRAPLEPIITEAPCK